MPHEQLHRQLNQSLKLPLHPELLDKKGKLSFPCQRSSRTSTVCRMCGCTEWWQVHKRPVHRLGIQSLQSTCASGSFRDEGKAEWTASRSSFQFVADMRKVGKEQPSPDRATARARQLSPMQSSVSHCWDRDKRIRKNLHKDATVGRAPTVAAQRLKLLFESKPISTFFKRNSSLAIRIVRYFSRQASRFELFDILAVWVWRTARRWPPPPSAARGARPRRATVTLVTRNRTESLWWLRVGSNSDRAARDRQNLDSLFSAFYVLSHYIDHVVQ